MPHAFMFRISRYGKLSRASESSPVRRKKHGAKSREREEQSLHIAQAGAQEFSTPKTNFSEPTIHQPEPAQKRRRTFNPSGAHSFYAAFSRLVLFRCVFRMRSGPNHVFIIQRFKLLDFVSGLLLHHDHDVFVGSVKQAIFSPATAEVVALSRFLINLDAALVVLGLDDVVPRGNLDRPPSAVHEVHGHRSIYEESDAHPAAAIETRTIEIQ